jgi:hypothetical protein
MFVTIEELLGTVFPVRFVQRLYNEQSGRLYPSRNAWGYNRATIFLGEINIGTWPSRLEKSQI